MHKRKVFSPGSPDIYIPPDKKHILDKTSRLRSGKAWRPIFLDGARVIQTSCKRFLQTIELVSPSPASTEIMSTVNSSGNVSPDVDKEAMAAKRKLSLGGFVTHEEMDSLRNEIKSLKD